MSDDAVTPDPGPSPEPNPEPADALPPLPAPRFDTQPYREYKPPAVVGSLLFLTSMSVAGFLVGLVVSFIALKIFYLLFIFPVCIGIALGAIGNWLVRFIRVREKFVLWAAGVLVAVATMFGWHFGYYLSELNDAEQQRPGARAIILNDPLAFFRLLDRRAERGLTILRRGRVEQNVGYVGSYAYWVFEMFLMGLMAYTLFKTAGAEPLCDRCQGWKRSRYLGRMTTVPPELVTGPLLDGQLLTLVDRATVTDDICLRFKAAICPTCKTAAPVDITLEQLAPNEKGHIKTTVLEQVRYPGDVLPFLDARRERA